MNLEELRRKIDETDANIVKLIGERIRIAREIGEQKKERGKQINDRAREKEVLDNKDLLYLIHHHIQFPYFLCQT